MRSEPDSGGRSRLAQAALTRRPASADSVAHASKVLRTDHLWHRHQSLLSKRFAGSPLRGEAPGRENTVSFMDARSWKAATAFTCLNYLPDAVSNNKMFVALQGCTIVLSFRCYAVITLPMNARISLSVPHEQRTNLKVGGQCRPFRSKLGEGKSTVCAGSLFWPR